MSQFGPLILLGILIFSLLLLVGLLPFILRSLGARNRRQYSHLQRETAVLDHALLDAAQRLRPFRKMKAHSYQEQREAVRRYLLEAREERREIDRRFQRTRLAKPPAGGWPGEFFLRQPAHYVTIPLDSWHLIKVGRSTEKINKSLETAAAKQEALHHITEALEQASTELHQKTLPLLAQAIEDERAAGLGQLDPFDERLHQLRQRTANLTGSLRAGPAAEDQQTDKLALELEALTTMSAALEKEIKNIHSRRTALDDLRLQTENKHETLLQSFPPERIPENLAPIIDHIDYLLQDADTQRHHHKFDECEACLKVAGQFNELNWRLYQTGQTLEQLVDIQQITPLHDSIRTTLTQWPPLINQAHQLVQPHNDNVSAGLQALSGSADNIKAQAEKILAEHHQILAQFEGRADKAMDDLASAWANLQSTLPLAYPDPLAESYNALWPKREAARGIPELLEQYIEEAGQLTRQINGTISTIQDQVRYVQETLGRLPKILNEAQKIAEDWRSLQNLAEQLAALRVSLENISQETFVATTREGVNAQLAAFHQQAEQIAQIQEEMRFEAHEIGRLDNIIREHWEAIQDNPMGLSEAKINRAVKMTDTQYERALSAERCKDTRAALEKCLNYVEKLALN